MLAISVIVRRRARLAVLRSFPIVGLIYFVYVLMLVEVDTAKNDISFELDILKDKDSYHIGQVPDTFTSHGSTQSGWKV